MNEPVFATQEIRHNIDGEMRLVGHSNDGEPIFKSVPKVIRPGTIFDLNDWPKAEQARLWDLGAIRVPNKAEIDMHKLRG